MIKTWHKLATTALVAIVAPLAGQELGSRDSMQAVQPTISSVPKQAGACIESNSLSRRVDFADVRRARHLLEHTDPWAGNSVTSIWGLARRRHSLGPCAISSPLPRMRA